MKQSTKRLKVVNKVSWFNLHRWINDKNVRKLVYKKLNEFDKSMVSKAHGLNIKMNSFNLSFHCCMHGYLSLLKHVVENFNQWNDKCRSFIFSPPINTLCRTAISHGHLDIVQWLIVCCGRELDTSSCVNAAQGGHLHILQWLRKYDCPWNKNTCKAAKENGHQHILDWIHANKCPCNCNQNK